MTIELSKIHDNVVQNPLPNPPPMGEGTEPSPTGEGQGGGVKLLPIMETSIIGNLK